MAHSTPARRKRKPAKPHPNFPLFPHANGHWAKKVKGKLRYFGPWSDPDAALARWLDEKDDLLAGREPRQRRGTAVLVDLVNEFLTARSRRVDSRELSPRTFADYHSLCSRLINHFGKNREVATLGPADFGPFRAELAVGNGPTSLRVQITRTKTVFKFGYDQELIDRPVRFGTEFASPPARVLRAHRNRRGPLMFEADVLQRVINAATPVLRPLVLLGINCAYGPADLAALPLSAVDLDGGWIDFPRPKTGLGRRCPLWGETIELLEETFARRPPPADTATGQLALLRPDGFSWVGAEGSRPITTRFRRLLKRLGLWRSGLGFYSLRRTHRTVSDEIPDAAAKDRIMGHQTPGQGAEYVQRIADSRLQAVTDHVRQWLFGREGVADE